MAHDVCPWWAGYLLISPLRRLFEKPSEILAPHVREGMTVLEPGPGMGFFTLDLARMVGKTGRVVAVDLQPRMVAGLRRRLAKARLEDRVDARVAKQNTLGVADLRGQVDFVLAYHVVHEMPEVASFFVEAGDALKPAGTLLLVEPAGHVAGTQFEAELQAASAAGLTVTVRSSSRRGHTAVLTRRSA